MVPLELESYPDAAWPGPASARPSRPRSAQLGPDRLGLAWSYELDDVWSVDLSKLVEYKCVLPLSESASVWMEEEEEEEEEGDGSVLGYFRVCLLRPASVWMRRSFSAT